MALLDSEGFGLSTNYADFVTYGILQALNGNLSIGTAGPYGDNYLQGTAGAGVGTRRVFKATAAAGFAGFRVLPIFSGNSWNNIYFQDVNAADLFSLRILSSGQIVVYSGSTQIGATALGALNVGAWQYLETGFTINSTTGTVTLRINGGQVLALTGVNTSNSGQSSVAAIQFSDNGGGVNLCPSVQHLYFCDNTGAAPSNTFLGDVRVQSLFPTGAGLNTSFAPTGQPTNWQNAATMPPNPTVDYNSSSTVGAMDTFGVGALDPTFSTIYGVSVKALVYKTTTGTRTMAAIIDSGGTIGTGPSLALSTSAAETTALFTTDPHTSAAWTTSGVQAAQPGYEIIS